MREDAAAKRQRVKKLAAKMFVEEGYEATTFAKLATFSDAAIGSINHFFKDKIGLARELYEDASNVLTRDVDNALVLCRGRLAEGVRGAQEAYLGWVKRSPDQRRLLERLDHVFRGRSHDFAVIDQRLTAVLENWAITLHPVPKLTPSQLYVAILAPVRFAASGPDLWAVCEVEWRAMLAAMAVAALGQRKGEASKMKVQQAHSSGGREPRLL